MATDVVASHPLARPVVGGPDEAGSRMARVGWIVVLLAAALLVVSLGLRVAVVTEGRAEYGAWGFSAGFLAFSMVGAAVLRRRPRSRVGWLLCATGLLHAVWDFTDIGARAVAGPAAAGLNWVSGWVYVPAFLLPALALLRVPDDRLPSARWRWVERTGVLACLAGVVGLMVGPDTPAAAAGEGAAALALPLLIVSGAVALVVRYRRAERTARQQLKWVLVSVVLLVVVLAVGMALPALGVEGPAIEAVLNGLSVALVPVGLGLAMLRHGLLAVDLVINRTLVLAGVSLLLAVLYITGIALVGGEVGEQQGIGAAVALAALVAVVLNPVRVRVQAVVDRLMFGERRNPYAVMTDVGAQLATAGLGDRVLIDVAESVSRALRVPSVTVELRHPHGDEPVARYGAPCGPELRIPLVNAEERVGTLAVGQRSPTEPFTAEERQLFTNLARQLGAAAHAAQLHHQLQQSRERLVIALEEERRRLRRELHDGLGPTLAGVALSLRAARATVTVDPPAATALLDRSSEQLTGVVDEIRRIVHDLRPPALDQLGLVEAIREAALRLTLAEPCAGLRIDLTSPAELPPLPAAVELAAYRACLEAITNVVRHARATRCTVSISCDDALQIEVHDDGVGIPPGARAGVGMASLRERAHELGGSTRLEPAPSGGTLVQVCLPLARR